MLAKATQPKSSQTRAKAVSPPTFRRILADERDLADRHQFSFSVFSIETGEYRRAELQKLISILMSRLRSSDLISVHKTQVRVLLRMTPSRTAKTVLRDLHAKAARIGLQLASTLYSYPLEDDGGPGLDELDDTLSITFEEPEPWWRRAYDILGSLLLIGVLLPVAGIIALAIKLDTPGSVLYSQWRAGKGGRPFRFYKFRSMSMDADERRRDIEHLNEKSGPIFKVKDDPRVTRVGRVLRRFSLDELPQLWNVLRGDMSLVGPRPALLTEVKDYKGWQRLRLRVKGGLTCIWQVSGRSDVDFEDWMRMDCRYAKRRTIWFDLSLLIRTIGAVLRAKGAY